MPRCWHQLRRNGARPIWQPRMASRCIC